MTEYQSDSQRVRVLLVDDHAVLRQGMAAMINEEPDLMVCGEADGVRAAIQTAEAANPDVAIVDLSIREGDGLELLRELKRRFPRVLSLVLSMYDESVYAERALRAGARGYIMKAEAARSVMTGIRRVLNGEIYLSPQMTERLAQNTANAASAKTGEFPPAPTLLRRLSDRELQVLRCVGRGLSTREAAEELFISIKTVEAHREHIKVKLGLSSSGELLRFAIEHSRVNG
ncbi:MAG TPA: response regulator transcription factor [Tepidisphaeraceae bacterium]|nr:response regulator transcription factor [Tepidisphaeraceae bacterium]